MTSNASDEQLLKDFAGGNQAALGVLAERYEPPLLGLATGILNGQQSLAFDAVQETWLRVIRFAGDFNGRSSFKTWLYRIAINQCHSLRAAQQPSPTTVELEHLPARHEPPGHPAEAAERSAALRAAVAGLGHDRGCIVLLCYHEGMTHEQVAEILDIPIGTLKSRLHAALEELRIRLSPEVCP